MAGLYLMSINKVAKLAGVSNSTVSRVINNHPRIAPETVKAVKKAMLEIKYTPSDRRPGPKPSFRTRTGMANIAFLVFGTSGARATPAFEQLLHGVSSGTSSFDLNLAFAHVPDASELPSRIFEQRLDGLLLHGAMPSPSIAQRLRKMPTVWLMGNRRRPDWGDQVMPDAYAIGELAARYLIGRGHQRLAFLNLDALHWPFRVSCHALTMTAQQSGVQVDRLERNRPDTSQYWPAHSADAVSQIVAEFVGLPEKPTGIFVADDMQTAMLQPALQAAGVKMGPGAVEIISCNNERPYLIGLNPRPATIDIRVEAIGRRGVEQLAWRLEHPAVLERLATAIEPMLVPNEDPARVN
ncbi:MAG: LacI family DNA-binding transcriptional regulator [Tepidisphaeraceae bacterium]